MSDFDNNYISGNSSDPVNAVNQPDTNQKGDINMPDDNKVTFDSIFNNDSNPPKPAPAPQADPGPAIYAAPPIYGAQPLYGVQPDAAAQPVYSAQPEPPRQPGYGPQPVYDIQPDAAAQPAYTPQPDPSDPVPAPVYPAATVPPAPPVYQASAPQPYPPYPYTAAYADPGMAPQVNYTAAPSGKSKEKTSFKAIAILVCVAVVLGCATLGLGLSLGGVLAKRLQPAADSTAAQSEVYTYNQPAVQHSASELSASGNIAEIVKNVSEAVVSINLTVSVPSLFNQITEQPGAGSGIIFAQEGDKVFVATNNHVVQNADKVTISLDDKTQVTAHFVGSDSQSDLAVIYVNKADLDKVGVPYKLANFGDSSKLQVGDSVVAIGNAMGEGKTATSGIISAINKQITIDGKTLDVIQTDAAINPGNSGGALADSKGEVIGINTAKLSSSNVEGMGYSIPTNIAKTILNDLKANGSVKKPFLGIQGMSITQEIKDMYQLPSLGVYVDSVTDGGSAQQGGIQPTDIIVGFNDTKITTIDELQAAIAASKVGDKVKIYIYRQGTHLMQFDVTLQNVNADAKF